MKLQKHCQELNEPEIKNRELTPINANYLTACPSRLGSAREGNEENEGLRVFNIFASKQHSDTSQYEPELKAKSGNRDNPKMRFKDSVKAVVGMDRPTQKDLDS